MDNTKDRLKSKEDFLAWTKGVKGNRASESELLEAIGLLLMEVRDAIAPPVVINAGEDEHGVATHIQVQNPQAGQVINVDNVKRRGRRPKNDTATTID